jgi:hypothetical protein
MSPYLCHAIIMAVHTVYPLARLGENKFVDPRFAHFTFKTVGMIRVVPGHDGLIEDWQIAHVAAVGAVRAYG